MTKSAQAESQTRWVDTLRSLMEARGMNPRSLSIKAGLGPTAVRDMLEGRARFPRYDTVEALARALDVTPGQLMGSEPGPADEQPREEDDLELLTEIIARLQEVAQQRRHELKPRDFAAMVTSLYRSAAPAAGTKKPSLSKISGHIEQLIDYEARRKGQHKG